VLASSRAASKFGNERIKAYIACTVHVVSYALLLMGMGVLMAVVGVVPTIDKSPPI